MNPISLYSIIGLALALLMSLLGNGGLWLHSRAVRAEAAQAVQSLDAAVDANASNIEAMTRLQASLTECVGKQQAVEALQVAAEVERDKAKATAANARASLAALKASALQSATCRANAELPVCPGLVGIQ